MPATASNRSFAHRGLWLLLLTVINGGYLWAAGSPTLFYVGNVLAHVLLGLAMIALWVGVGKALLRRNEAETPAGFSLVLLTLIVLAAGTGLALLLFGNLRPQRPVLVAHIASSFGAALGTLWWLRSRGVFAGRPWLARASAAVVVLAVAVPLSRPLWPPAPGDVITNPTMPPADMAGEAMGGADGPFFPSAAETAHGGLIPGDFFLDSKACGRAGCHPDATAQWDDSAHRFSSFNNQWYRKSIEYMQEVTGLEKPKWCAGCHDHALLFAGEMARPVAEMLDEPEAHAGLACVSCHSVARVKNTMGNGGFVLEYPEMHDLATSENKVVQALHDFVLRLDPEPHRRAFLKPFHREQPAEFCSSCHKVHLDEPVNHYRWLRGFNTYDNWQASGVSGQGARSFYEPSEPKNCLTCHMPYVPSDDAGNHDGFIRSHRFIAAHTALPTANQDTTQFRQTIDFLENGKLRVDLFAVSEPAAEVAVTEAERRGGEMPADLASTFAVGEEQAEGIGRGSLTREAVSVLAPLEDGDAVLRPGTSARLDVVVRTLDLGHFFPTGTVDAQEAWLEVKAVDDAGRVLFWSGWTEDDGRGPVDPSAHFFRSLMVDAHANRIDKRNAFATRAVVYVNLIPPGAAHVVHYRLHIPEDVGQTVTLTAKLHYRKFDWHYNQFAYAGVRDPADPNPDVTLDYDDGRWVYTGDTKNVSGALKTIPVLPIVTMAADSVTLAVAPVVETAPREDGRTDARMRWNDYGIGLLLEGDLKGAEQAFRRVTEIAPDYADGWINLVRVYLQEGDLDAALPALETAERVRPGFHKALYFRGIYHKARGEYEEALESLTRAAEAFPRDRVVLNQIGRVHYLNAEPEKAVPFFERVLAIDPEDLMAHYNLMLCRRALGQTELAAEHEKRYLRFKEDEASRAIARQYRQTHPHDNNEALPIHEHADAGAPLR